MSTVSFWRAVATDGIDTDHFPAVPLYLKSGTNYLLYKPAERPFTESDRSRLVKNGTRFLYVRSGDMQEIATHLEGNLKNVLARDDLDSRQKGVVLYQTSVNYVIETFEDPEQAENLDRCKELVQNLMAFVAKDPATLLTINKLMDFNYYIFAHSTQMAALNLLAHEALFGVDPDELMDVGVGSLLHDFGIGILTENATKKADALKDVEYWKLKRHAQLGYEALKGSGMFNDVVLTVVRHHHERFDGDGYPSMLKGNNIPRSAQLAAMCDTYSALTLGNPGALGEKSRPALPPAEAIREMRMESGKAFGAELLARFIDLLTAQKVQEAA